MTPSRGASWASRSSHMTRSTPSIASARVDDRGAHRVALGLVQRVDHRRALRGADGDPRLVGVASRSDERDRARARRARRARPAARSCRVTGAWEWSAITITACSARNSSTPPAAFDHARELQVGLGDRLHLRVGTVLVRVPVVVGQRQQQEVEQVVLDQVARRRSRSGGRARRACRARSGSRCGARRRCRRRTARAGPSPGGASAPRRRASARCRAGARGGGGRGTSGRSCRRCARRRRRASRTRSASRGERCARFML